MVQVVLEPNGIDAGAESRWMVVIQNNESNSFADVIAVLVAATGCTVEEAAMEAWEAHTFGKASVHFASKSCCAAAAVVIRAIGVATDVVPEWT